MQISLLSVSKGISQAISGPKKLYMSAWSFIQGDQPPKVKFYASQLQSPLPLPKQTNKQPNLAFLSGRPTSSSDLALSRSSSVQRLFFCGDVIAITSWAPDVVNLVRPI